MSLIRGQSDAKPKKLRAAAAFAAAFRRLRDTLRLSQGAIGERFGVGWRTVHRWEHQYAMPKPLVAREIVSFATGAAPASAIELAQALGVEVPRPIGSPAPAPGVAPRPALTSAKLHGDLRAAADDLDVTARALRRVLRGMIAELAAPDTTLRELDALLAEPPRKMGG